MMRSVAVVFLVSACVASAALTPKNVELTRIGEPLPPRVDPKRCPECVNLMIQALDVLVNAIANGGVIGGCQDLCGYLPDRVEAYACSALCVTVGVEELVKALNGTDPDPIYACEAIGICPTTDTARANITSYVVDPKVAPMGSTFYVNMTFTIFNTTGTAIVQIWTIPPNSHGKADISETGLLIETPPGDYRVSFEYDTKGDSSQFWPGVYNSTLWLCEGYCASAGIHPHQYILDQRDSVLFEITKKPSF